VGSVRSMALGTQSIPHMVYVSVFGVENMIGALRMVWVTGACGSCYWVMLHLDFIVLKK